MITFKNNWQKCSLNINASVGDAIKNLQQSGYKIIFIVDSKKKILGIITDGDIRRGLLAGYNINSSIENIIKTKFHYVRSNINNFNILEFMFNNEIFQLPLIDKNKKLLGFYIPKQKKNKKNIKNKLFILAGGKGLRLRPLTNKTPKPMLKINNKPILEHIILHAKKCGITDIVISVNYLSNKIEKYFKNGSNFGVSISYVKEKNPMGTIGSISLIKNIPKEPIIVINGDIITDIDYHNIISYHKKNKSSATMAVRVFESKEFYGFVKTNRTRIIGFEEKPITRTYINSGIYVLQPATIIKLKKILKKYTKIDMPDLFNFLRKERLKTIIFPFFGYWKDIGNKSDYESIKKIKKFN